MAAPVITYQMGQKGDSRTTTIKFEQKNLSKGEQGEVVEY